MTPGFGPLPLGSRAAALGVHPPGVSGVGAQADDQGAHIPRGFGSVPLVSLADNLGAHRPGLQVCAGAAYLVFIVQRLREWGCKRLQLLQRIL